MDTDAATAMTVLAREADAPRAPGLDLTWITAELAIGGRFTPAHVPALAGEHRVAAIVDLRAEDRDDEALLAAHGIALLHLPTPDHGALAPGHLRAGLAFVEAHLLRGGRVLLHGEHGIGRSATLGLCVLVHGGMTPLGALALAKDRRGRVAPSPAQHEGWAAWLRAAGREPPPFEVFAAIAYRHLAAGTEAGRGPAR